MNVRCFDGRAVLLFPLVVPFVDQLFQFVHLLADELIFQVVNGERTTQLLEIDDRCGVVLSGWIRFRWQLAVRW